MCIRHWRAHRRTDAAAKQRKRDERRAEGLCIWCPGDKPQRASEAGGSSCLACRIRRGRIRDAEGGVSLDVYRKQREQQIAGATRRDDDGRTRYFGQQKRGQQPKQQLNMQDLAHVAEDFEAFSEGVRLLAAPETQKMHRSDIARAEAEVAIVGDRMNRRTDDILERLGHFKQRHGRRDGE